MYIVESFLGDYKYRPYDWRTDKGVRVFDTSDGSSSVATTSQIYKLLYLNPNTEFFNADIIQEMKQCKKWDYTNHTYIVQEKIKKKWLNLGGVFDEQSGSVKINALRVQPLLHYSNRMVNGTYTTEYPQVILDNLKIWLADGTGFKGQPKQHLMVWWNNTLYCINYDAISGTGKFFYRDSTNTCWTPRTIPQTENLYYIDERTGRPRSNYIYCQLTYFYFNQGIPVLVFSFLDRYSGEEGQFEVSLASIQGMACPKGRIVKQFLTRNRDLRGVNGFSNI